jgi:hypothetical protein
MINPGQTFLPFRAPRQESRQALHPGREELPFILKWAGNTIIYVKP